MLSTSPVNGIVRRNLAFNSSGHYSSFMPMVPFHSRCPAGPAEATFGFEVAPGGALAPGQYAVEELYCDEPACDCRRALLRIVPRGKSVPVLASISYGWETPEFYERTLSGDSEAARAITCGCLDPLNQKSPIAPVALKIFQSAVAGNEFGRHLKTRYRQFRATLRTSR
ncbi:hypothetical protein GC207_13315 [bacterium]|nr:hypothetical protein [bacterium]